jgi:hypothetical protein
MQTEDHLAYSTDYPPPSVFDPDNVLTQALLNQLASATSTSSQVLCQPFIRSGTIVTDTKPILFNRGLLDTGAQGSNFISRHVFESLPPTITDLSRSIDRVVRLGDARSLSIQLEVPLTVGILDSTNNIHQHTLWYSVLDVLSHDIIIGLVDLIGPFYELFADSQHLVNCLSHLTLGHTSQISLPLFKHFTVRVTHKILSEQLIRSNSILLPISTGNLECAIVQRLTSSSLPSKMALLPTFSLILALVTYLLIIVSKLDMMT